MPMSNVGDLRKIMVETSLYGLKKKKKQLKPWGLQLCHPWRVGFCATCPPPPAPHPWDNAVWVTGTSHCLLRSSPFLSEHTQGYSVSKGSWDFLSIFFIEPSNSPWNFHFSILTIVSLCQQDRGPFQQACFQKECVIMLSPSSDYRHLAIKTHPATCWRGWGPEHGATAPKMQTHSLSYP